MDCLKYTQLPQDLNPLIKEYLQGYKTKITTSNSIQEVWIGNKKFKTGNYKSWYSNGKLMSDKNYKEGKLHGNSKWWFDNGQIWTDRNYKEGKLHGNSKGWYSNGQIEYDKNYKEGKLYGNDKLWYSNGKLWSDKLHD